MRSGEISRTLTIPGYVLDKDILMRIDSFAARALALDGESERTYSITVNHGTIDFGSLAELLRGFNESLQDVKSVSLVHKVARESGVAITFYNDGEIDIFGFSESADLEFNIGRLCEIIKESEDEYAWPIRTFVFKGRWKWLSRILLLLLSLFLLFNVAYYLYAKRVGINIDPTLIPKGEQVSQQIADALKSPDLQKKLNALLTVQLRDFTNVDDILIRQRQIIVTLLASIAFLAVCELIRRVFEKLYPRFFLMFGHNIRLMERLERKRQLWGGAVIIGFLINIAAGIVVALLSR